MWRPQLHARRGRRLLVEARRRERQQEVAERPVTRRVGGQAEVAAHLVELAGDVATIGVGRAAGVGSHHGVGDAEDLRRDVAAVRRGLADDRVGLPRRGQAEEVGHDVEHGVVGEDPSPRPRVARRAGWDRRQLGEPARHVGRQPWGPDGMVVEPGADHVGRERARRGERDVVTGVAQPAGDGQQRVEVARARQRREQEAHRSIMHLTGGGGLERR